MFSQQKCPLNYPTWSYAYIQPLLSGVHVDTLTQVSCLFLPSYVVFKFSPIFCSPVSMGNILLSVNGMAASYTVHVFWVYEFWRSCCFAYELNFIELQSSSRVMHYSNLLFFFTCKSPFLLCTSNSSTTHGRFVQIVNLNSIRSKFSVLSSFSLFVSADILVFTSLWPCSSYYYDLSYIHLQWFIIFQRPRKSKLRP